MKILSVNAGSSSLKFQMYEMPEEKVLINGYIQKIGASDSFYYIKINGEKITKEAEINNHEDAVNILIKELLENKIINSLEEIDGVGHRMVHGGDKYPDSCIITEDVIEECEKLKDLAPLHVPANILCVRAFQKLAPNALEVAVFDTAFHQTIEEEKFRYAVPNEWYEKYGVRKYGFHGTSHKYISERVKEYLGKDNYKVIICHIGSGASISAVKDGKCVDTTMGFTPNSGIVMGTRSGDIDYGIIPYIMKKTGMSIDEVDSILNKQSGLLGLSEVSNDWRDIYDAIVDGNEKAILASEVMFNSIAGYIAKYYMELEGVDAICFTAGLGENNGYVRKKVCDRLKCFGIEINDEINEVITLGKEGIISTDNSKIKVYAIPTDEEVVIARDTYKLK